MQDYSSSASLKSKLRYKLRYIRIRYMEVGLYLCGRIRNTTIFTVRDP